MSLQSTPSSWRLGLTGYPLGHSISPQIQGAALRSLGLQGEYRLYPVAPGAEGPGSLAELVGRLRAGDLHGLNVTIPHKQAIMPLLDELTPIARAIGAVNTIFRQGERLIGDNTDAPGFLTDLESLTFPGFTRPAVARVALILGAGGSARAVVYALAQAGWQPCLAVLRPQSLQRAHSLAEEIGRVFPKPPALGPSDLAALDFAAHPVHLIVNCTPVGMSPHPDENPWPAQLAFPAGAFVYDLVYNPAVTQLTAAARAAGLSASTGLGMLVAQAALAFERWTGMLPGLAPLRAAAEAALR